MAVLQLGSFCGKTDAQQLFDYITEPDLPFGGLEML